MTRSGCANDTCQMVYGPLCYILLVFMRHRGCSAVTDAVLHRHKAVHQTRRACAQDTAAPAEQEFRPPSPKYDERTFFMSTQNPWVAARSAASPNKRSPATARRAASGAACVTPPVFNLAYSAAQQHSAGIRSHGVASANGLVAPDGGLALHSGISAAANRHAQAEGRAAGGAGSAAVRVGDVSITPPSSSVVQAPPEGVARPPDREALTLPAQKRARLESQARILLAHQLERFNGACMSGFSAHTEHASSERATVLRCWFDQAQAA